MGVDLRAIGDRLGEDGRDALECRADGHRGGPTGCGRGASALHRGDEPRKLGLEVADERHQLAADQRQDDQHAPAVRGGRRRNVAEAAQRTECGQERQRESAAPLVVLRLAQRLQELHRADPVVLGAKLQRGRRAEVPRGEQLVLQRAPDVDEHLLGRDLHP